MVILFGEGGISVLKLGEHGSSEVDCYLTPGASPAYVGIDREKNLIYTANYHTAVRHMFNVI